MFAGADIGLTLLLIGLFTVGAGAIVGTVIATSKGVKKHKVLKNEAGIRKQLAEKGQNPNKLKALVKKHYKYQMKSPVLTESLIAQLKYLQLSKGRSQAVRKKIQKVQSKLNRIVVMEKTAPIQTKFTEKAEFAPDEYITLTSNSIQAPPSIVEEYKLALQPESIQNKPGHPRRFVNQFTNRDLSGGIYPMELSIKNSKGEEIYFLSDVSSERFYEFANKLMAKLAVDYASGATKEVYTVSINDTGVKSKGPATKMTDSVTSAEDCANLVNDMFLFMKMYFKKFNKNLTPVNFSKLVDIYSHESRISGTEPNKLYFKNELKSLTSQYLITKFNIAVEKSGHYKKESKPCITTLNFNNSDMLRYSSDNEELLFLMKPYILAYATVMAYDRYKNTGGFNNINLVTQKLNANMEVEEVKNEPLDDFFTLFSYNKSDPVYMEALREIAKEKNITINFNDMKNPMNTRSQFVTVEKNSIESKRPTLIKEFNDTNKNQKRTGIDYTTRITNGNEFTHIINLTMNTDSREVQLEYFYQLLLEAYVIGSKELSETKNLTPIIVSVEQSSGSAPQDMRYTTLEDLKKDILNFAKFNLNKTINDTEFEKEVKSVEKDMYDGAIFTF